jgi:hypothetical protein
MRLEARAIDGLEAFLDAAPEMTREAARIAMNDVTGGSGLKTYKNAMKMQVSFPPGYLDDVDRFGQTSYATNARLETTISARSRPTSLARFSSGTVNQAGATIHVKPTRSVSVKKAFLVRLRAGNVLDQDNFNLGLAVRIAPGTVIRNKRDTSRMVHLAPNVVLLYGPSVDQVFRTVADTETPAVLDMMGLEFLRQFGRLSGGR